MISQVLFTFTRWECTIINSFRVSLPLGIFDNYCFTKSKRYIVWIISRLINNETNCLLWPIAQCVNSGTSCGTLFTYLLFVVWYGVLHSAYIQQEGQVIQNMLGERHLVSVHKEFGQSMGPQTMTVLWQKLLYSLTHLSWHGNSGRFWGGARGRIGRRGEGDLQKGQNVRANLEGGSHWCCILFGVERSCRQVVSIFTSTTGIDCKIDTCGKLGSKSWVEGRTAQRDRWQQFTWRGSDRLWGKNKGGLS